MDFLYNWFEMCLQRGTNKMDKFMGSNKSLFNIKHGTSKQKQKWNKIENFFVINETAFVTYVQQLYNWVTWKWLEKINKSMEL